MAIGDAGAVNAAIHAAKEVAIGDPAIKERLLAYAEKRKNRVAQQNAGLQQKLQTL
jgi:phosphoribosylcarboxyaminoimidazole (NCAIR) mutase